MPQTPDWKRALETGMHFTEMRRSQARRLASDLVAQGQLARDQLGAAVDELVEISRHRSEELRNVVRTEVQRQLGSLGLATKRDLVELERRLRPAAVANATKKGPKTAPAKKAPKKAPAKKAPAKKKSAGKKSTVKKAGGRAGAGPARRAPAKKSR